jgi:hypothetical protein
MSEKYSKLLKYTEEDTDLFYSQDMKIDRKLKTELDLHLLKDKIKKITLELKPVYNEIIGAYAKKNKLERIAILYAHGGEVNKKWYYYRGEKAFSVQSWINKMDGKYKILILGCCNPGANEISPKKSPVLASNESHKDKEIENGEVHLELYLPKKGYLDSYTIEEELRKLKE